MEENENNKKISGSYFLVSGIPIIIYPGIFIASLMSLAGHITGDESFFLLLVVKGFLWLSLLYPLVFFLCLILFYSFKGEKEKVIFRKIPFIYLGVCIFLLFLWGIAGN